MTAFFATQIPRLEIDASAEIQMLKRDYDETRKRFGDEKLTVILATAEDVFSSPILKAI